MVVFFGFKSGALRFTYARAVLESPRRLGSEARKKMSALGREGVRNLKHTEHSEPASGSVLSVWAGPPTGVQRWPVCATLFFSTCCSFGIHHLRAARARASQAGILSDVREAEL
jgi:hypothetical protein